jgi:hypothetical protein
MWLAIERECYEFVSSARIVKGEKRFREKRRCNSLSIECRGGRQRSDGILHSLNARQAITK